MENRLYNASMKFHLACVSKLQEKEKEGWEGWNNKKEKSYFEGRIMHDAFSKLTQKRLVHIANFCNFLWNLIEIQKGEDNGQNLET